MNIQMKRKEQTKTFMMILDIGLYKNILAL